MKKLAIIQTHPIQYNSPWFSLLAAKENFEVKVFYTYSQRQYDFFDKDFGVEIKWDIPLFDGYDYQWIENRAKNPGLEKFKGIVCPELIPSIIEWGATNLLVIGWNYQAHLSVMRYFKGKIPVWFRGDSTLLDYDVRKISDIPINNILKGANQLLKYKIRQIFLTWIYKYVDGAFYVGTNSKEYFLAHGLVENQLIYTPHAVDNDRFNDNSDRSFELEAEKWRSDLGLKQDDFVLLFAGKFESKKCPDVLMDAVIVANQYNTNPLQLLLVGNGSLENQLKDRAKPYDFINFIPFQNQTQMPVVYRLGDVFCLPSKGPGETWGLAVNEAMACGKPVIISDRVGCAIDLVNKVNGVIFKSGETQDLIAKLEHLSNSSINFNRHQIMNSIKSWSFDSIATSIYKSFVNGSL